MISVNALDEDQVQKWREVEEERGPWPFACPLFRSPPMTQVSCFNLNISLDTPPRTRLCPTRSNTPSSGMSWPWPPLIPFQTSSGTGSAPLRLFLFFLEVPFLSCILSCALDRMIAR